MASSNSKPRSATRKHRDEPKLRVSMADVARRAGVHQTTVSLALRDSPKLPAETRAKIQGLAREMGYRRDALVASLMAQVHAGRRRDESPVLACLADGGLGKFPSFADFIRGFAERARELGYQAEEIACGDGPGAMRDVPRHLRARGIQAAFLPLTRSNLLERHDFTGIALVTLSGSLRRPPLHVVGPNHFHNARLATRRLWEAGSRRFLLAVPPGFEPPALHEWFGAMAAELRQADSTVPPPRLLRVAPGDSRSLATALRKGKIDGVLAYPSELRETFGRAGLRIPEDVNYADPALFPEDTECAGIDPLRHRSGAAAADVLVAQIHRGEFGLPRDPRTILTDGRWVPGPSCRRRAGEEKGA
ncbi:MAG: LacI family DNA-binding transcriptional regulator [Puniceicoccaceae bacterium]